MARYISDNDYAVVIDKTAFDAIKKNDASKVQLAEELAIDEIKGYLDAYDVDRLFSYNGTWRPAKLIGIICDMALYHLNSTLPGRMGNEIRGQRYQDAIAWLKLVQKGQIVPTGFPRIIYTDDNSSVMIGGKNPVGFEW